MKEVLCLKCSSGMSNGIEFIEIAVKLSDEILCMEFKYKGGIHFSNPLLRRE